MEIGAPQWIDKIEEKYAGLDLLGVANPFRRIQTEFIPVITGATKRPRYYSFFCWIIDRFHKSTVEKNFKNWAQLLYKYESLLIYACKYHHASSSINGVVGTNGMLNFEGQVPAQLPISKSDVERASAWEPASYKPSFAGLNLAHYQARTPPSLVEGIGVELAAAFEESLGKTLTKTIQVLEADDIIHVDLEVVEEFSKKACLCGAGISLRETNALVNAVVFGESVKAYSPFDLKLNLSFELFLEVASQGFAITDPPSFDELIYCNGVSEELVFKIPNHLETTFIAWRTLGLRSYQQLSLELVWNSVHKYFAGRTFDQSGLKLLAERCATKLIDLPASWKIDPGTQSVANIHESLSRQLFLDNSSNGFSCFFSQNSLSDLDLFLLAQESFDSEDFVTAINVCALMILASTQRVEHIGKPNHVQMISRWTSFGGEFSLGISHITSKIHNLSQLQWSEFIFFLLEAWALSKHMWTASLKFHERGIYTYRFELTEDGYSPKSDVDYNIPGSKVGTIMDLCLNLGLTSLAKADDKLAKTLSGVFGEDSYFTYKITSEGMSALEHLRELRK